MWQRLLLFVKNGEEIVLTHGNGPQVGQIAFAMEYSSKGMKLILLYAIS